MKSSVCNAEFGKPLQNSRVPFAMQSLGSLCKITSLILFMMYFFVILIDPIALRKAKIVCNLGLSECNRVNFLVVSAF